jgi:exodeoxyribonuclease V alpha subunit
MPRTIEIKAVFIRERIRFDNSDTIVGDIRLIESPECGFSFDGLPCSIKGESEIDELRPQCCYLFFGHWTRYTNQRTRQAENQFKFVSFVESQPLDRESVIAYLKIKGKGCNIGAARAAKLADKFGSDAVRIAREQPDVISAAIDGVSLEQAQHLAAVLELDKHRENCHIQLMALLRGRGFPKKTADQAMRKWGNRAPEIIRRDPYKMMQFRGCGFRRTDQMYLNLGLPAARLKRQALCAWYAIASDSSGDTWFPVEKCVAAINASIGGVDANPKKAILLAKRAGLLAARRDDDGKVWLAEKKKADHERTITKHLQRAASDFAPWVGPDGSESFDSRLSQHQQDRLASVFEGGKLPAVWILGGSPGTGKTFCAASFIRQLGAQHGYDQIAVCAPTGKAAVRITEAMKANDIPLRARTIHSLLGVMQPDDGGGEWGFRHCQGDPLPFRFVVVDESSMVDAGLMASLLSARGIGTGIAFIGDVNQLAPVGHGAPLRDMIAAGLPYAELTEIQRNSGLIVESCASIRDGRKFGFATSVDVGGGKNLAIAPAGHPEIQISKMLVAIRAAAVQGFDPVWDVQVLCPVNQKSPICRKQLNTILQRELNPNHEIPNCPFKVGDKIVNTKNRFFKALECDETSGDLQTNDKGEVYVANGELAKVVEIEGGTITASLSNPSRLIQIFRGPAESEDGGESESPTTGCTFDLGYALSVHKYQGSEVPIALVMLDEYPGAKMVQTREYLYTAISRAKKLCICIGKQETATAMVARRALWKRKTFLREQIIEQQTDLTLVHTT